MPILQARIETERARRYLTQLCKHAAAMGSGGGHWRRVHSHGATPRGDLQVTAEWSDSHGTVTFDPWGRCTLTADAATLTVSIDATDADGLQQIQEVITRDLTRFSGRKPLAVIWQQP